ncbi:MAG: type II toxin-antitoxin system HipA family toxin [Spirochaetia bacterium]|nr:type II toxin-antitoxin system HipA family toxin [Spirochaetia bacterium]
MKALPSVPVIHVGLDFGTGRIPVGRLAVRERRIYFEYKPTFIEQGLEISPFMIPLKAGVRTCDSSLFEGLPGVFNDSLPDGWGRLLFDRFALSQRVMPSEMSPLDRLASVGSHGLGALVYEPESDTAIGHGPISLDGIASHVQEVLKGASEEVLQELLALNGAAAGARPKALIGVSESREHIIHGTYDLEEGFEPWLVKFPNSQDGLDAGSVEYAYALMAKAAGITMPDVHLFPSGEGPGYFATKRFDRDGTKRFHMHTAGGLLHADVRVPSLDYQDLLALTFMLTRDIREVERMYRLAVFNVLAHNRDDHGKNFSFLMDAEGQWKLSPAYDLTFSSGPGGEQSTMVMGEGRNPGVEHLIKLGLEAKLAKLRITEIIEQTRSALSAWPELAKQYGVSEAMISLIAQRVCM